PASSPLLATVFFCWHNSSLLSAQPSFCIRVTSSSLLKAANSEFCRPCIVSSILLSVSSLFTDPPLKATAPLPPPSVRVSSVPISGLIFLRRAKHNTRSQSQLSSHVRSTHFLHSIPPPSIPGDTHACCVHKGIHAPTPPRRPKDP
ncbi:unnamed protein product, partial [Ectocarpus sp. 4 AP-2014]